MNAAMAGACVGARVRVGVDVRVLVAAVVGVGVFVEVVVGEDLIVGVRVGDGVLVLTGEGGIAVSKATWNVSSGVSAIEGTSGFSAKNTA